MADGTTRAIETVRVGDDTAGGMVTATMTFHRRSADPLYALQGVSVTGDHAVLDVESGQFTRVKNAKGAKPLTNVACVAGSGTTGRHAHVYDFTCDDHRIYVVPPTAGDVVVFADYAEVDYGSNRGFKDEVYARHLRVLNAKGP